MILYDDFYNWEGFGGKLRLGHGKCRLRVFDLSREPDNEMFKLMPYVVVVQDIADSPLSMRSCSGHIATGVAKSFNIPAGRMLYVEFYEKVVYGENGDKVIPERLEAATFDWRGDKALKAHYRPLDAPMAEYVRGLLKTVRRD